MMKKAVILLIFLVLLSLETPIYAAKKTSAKRTVQSVSSNTKINYARLAKKVLPSIVRIITAKNNQSAQPNMKAQESMSAEEWDKLWNGSNSFKSNSDSMSDLWTIYNDFPMY